MTKKAKMWILAAIAAIGAIAGIVRGVLPDHTVADKVATTTEQVAPHAYEAVEKLPTTD